MDLSPRRVQRRYRSEVPQHHHRDLLSSRVGCRPSVLGGHYGCGCMEFGTKRPRTRLANGFAATRPRPVRHDWAPRPLLSTNLCPEGSLGPLSTSGQLARRPNRSKRGPVTDHASKLTPVGWQRGDVRSRTTTTRNCDRHCLAAAWADGPGGARSQAAHQKPISCDNEFGMR